jgi:head-tail adaptor
MTNQHRATPEQWEHVQICAGMKQQIPWATADCILELRARIESLEAAQLEQAESNRFCTDAIVRRVEALEATQHAHADVSRLSDAEREQVAQELAKPAAWRPLEVEITYGSDCTTTAQQILRAPRMVEGTFEHGGETYRFKAKPERDSAMAELRAASAEVRPTVKDSLTDGGGLVERVVREIADAALNADSYDPEGEARAAIREVAAWLREGGDYSADAWADMLEREVFHG